MVTDPPARTTDYDVSVGYTVDGSNIGLRKVHDAKAWGRISRGSMYMRSPQGMQEAPLRFARLVRPSYVPIMSKIAELTGCDRGRVGTWLHKIRRLGKHCSVAEARNSRGPICRPLSDGEAVNRGCTREGEEGEIVGTGTSA